MVEKKVRTRPAQLYRGEQKVLFALMDLLGAGERPLLRSIAARCGWTSLMWVWTVLRQLRKRGLVSFEDGKRSTLQVLYRFEPVNTEGPCSAD